MLKNSASILLSKFIIIIFFVFTVATIPFIPTILKSYIEIIGEDKLIIGPLILTFYSTVPFALVLLFCLYLLLNNICHDNIFLKKNILLLRISSWCCFYSSFVYIIFSMHYLLALLISVIITFVGLILRVIKNVLRESIDLKIENDFTI